MSKTFCGCDISKVEIDPITNSTVCTKCGLVIDDGCIVSDIQFEENTNGMKSVVGQLVSSDSKNSSDSGMMGIQRDYREYTINKARKFITSVGEQLRLSSQCQNVALNFFKMALSGNLTRGRMSSYIYGSCMYIACRLEGTSHFLIDFADHMQVNFTQLGRTYLDISSALSIHVPISDPSAYILRFVNQMNLGSKLNDVASTALRILRRMKKDMIECGRRPSGVCGAALYIAARFHNFQITIADIIKIAHVTHSTIKKRLIEFNDTPSSLLTVDKFLHVDLPEMEDPPSFKKKTQFQLPKSLKTKKCSEEFIMLERTIEEALEAKKKRKSRYEFLDSISDIGEFYEEESSKGVGMAENEMKNIVMGVTLECIDSCIDQAMSTPQIGEKGTSSSKRGMGPTWETMGMWESPDENIIPEGFEQIEEDELDDLNEEELDSYILAPADVKVKSKAWNKRNKKFMKEQKERKERLSTVKPPEKKVVRKRKRYPPIQAASAEEAVEKIIKEKKLSNKIDYEILDALDINVFTKVKEAKDIADSMKAQQINNYSSENKPSNLDISTNENCESPEKKCTITDVEKALKVAPFKRSSTNMPIFKSCPFVVEEGFDGQFLCGDSKNMPNMLDAVIKYSTGSACGRNVESIDLVDDNTIVGNERNRMECTTIENNPLGDASSDDSKTKEKERSDEVKSLLQLLNRKDKFECMLHPTLAKNNVEESKLHKKSDVKKRKSKMISLNDTGEPSQTKAPQKKRKLKPTNNTERNLSFNKFVEHTSGKCEIKIENGKVIISKNSDRTLNEDKTYNFKEQKIINEEVENAIKEKLGRSKPTEKNELLPKETKIQVITKDKVNKNSSPNAVGPVVSISFFKPGDIECTSMNETEAERQPIIHESEIPDSVENIKELVRQDLSNRPADQSMFFRVPPTIDDRRREVLNNVNSLDSSTNSTAVGLMNLHLEISNYEPVGTDEPMEEGEPAIDENINDDDEEYDLSDEEEEFISMQDELAKHMNDLSQYGY